MSYADEEACEITPEDVRPDAVVAVISHGSGSYSSSQVFLLENFDGIASLFNSLGLDCAEMMGEDSYIEEYIDQSDFKKPENADNFDTVCAYLDWLDEDVKKAGKDVGKLSGLLGQYTEDHEIEYLGTIREFVENETISDVDTGKKFKLPGDEAKIAHALNRLNSY
jgi:hypothetical protein